MASTFRSLRHRNARLFFAGLALSNIGTWMQFTAVALVIDDLTGQTTAIGILTALQFGPMLLLGAWGGAVADQHDRRRLTIITQAALSAQAAAMAVFAVTGTINVPIIYALTLALGIISVIDNPSRRGFVTELVPADDVANAVSLNTATMTGSRIFGPAIAAVLIGPFGATWLFAVNAVSFVAILGSLFLIRSDELHPVPLAPRGGTPIRDGLRFVRHHELLLPTFVCFTIVSTFAFNYNIVFPRMSRESWGGEAWYGWVLATLSIGSLLGSLMTASRTVVTLRWFIGMGLLAAVAGIAVAAPVDVWFILALAVPLGVGNAGVVTAMNAITQQECPPDMRGRILALTAVAFLGSYPIGGPITGLVGDYVGLAWSIAYGAIISLIAVLALAWWALGRRPDQSRIAVLRSLLGTTDPVAPTPSEHP